MTYRVVPLEPDMKMLEAANIPSLQMFNHGHIMDVYTAMLAARPPLPEDVQKALKLAEEMLVYYDDDRSIRRPTLADTAKIARALLKVCGK